MTHAHNDHKPPKIEAVGNGNYLYRWDIQEETIEHEIMQEGKSEPLSSEKTVQYSCYETTVHGKPEYGKCVEAVIRESYTSNEEIALVNKYNAYQMGVHNDHSVVEEYEKYLSFVTEVKNMVRQDLGEETPTETGSLYPRLADVARLLSMTVNTMTLSDEDALSVKSLYPQWDKFIGKPLTKDMKVQHDGKLYKVLQDIPVVLENQSPSVETAALYTEISETHSGNADDPIPYNNNMELEKGKYYIQDGKTYLCTRDTEVPVYQPLAELVGIYVELQD